VWRSGEKGQVFNKSTGFVGGRLSKTHRQYQQILRTMRLYKILTGKLRSIVSITKLSYNSVPSTQELLTFVS